MNLPPAATSIQGPPGNACPGFIANAPDFDLYWTAGSGFHWSFRQTPPPGYDLVVHTPDGCWLCEDDGGFTCFNPGMRIDNPISGLYDIRVGTYSATGGNYPPATLSDFELTSY
ncbi:MAG: hypothetical protein R3C25_13640 [Hyphomonadaceae bacterium]